MACLPSAHPRTTGSTKPATEEQLHLTQEECLYHVQQIQRAQERLAAGAGVGSELHGQYGGASAVHSRQEVSEQGVPQGQQEPQPRAEHQIQR